MWLTSGLLTAVNSDSDAHRSVPVRVSYQSSICQPFSGLVASTFAANWSCRESGRIVDDPSVPTTEYLGAQRRHAWTGQTTTQPDIATGPRRDGARISGLGCDLVQVGVRRHRLGSARYLRRAGSRVPRTCSSTGSQHFSKCWGRVGAAAGTLVKPPLTMSSLSSRRVRMIVSATARCFRYPTSGALRRVCGLLRKGSADWQTGPAGRSVRAQAQRSKRLFAVGGFASKIPRRLARYPLDCKKTMRLASPEGHAPSPSIHQD